MGFVMGPHGTCSGRLMGALRGYELDLLNRLTEHPSRLTKRAGCRMMLGLRQGAMRWVEVTGIAKDYIVGLLGPCSYYGTVTATRTDPSHGFDSSPCKHPTLILRYQKRSHLALCIASNPKA